MFAIPVIHPVEINFRLVHDRFVSVQNLEIVIRDQGSAFDDHFFLDIEASHFKIDPKDFLLGWLHGKTHF